MSAKSILVIRWAAILLLVTVLVGGLVGRAQAVVINNDGTLPAGQTVDDDLILTANTVTMDGTVNGTLIAAGQLVTINGLVKSDALVFGETLIIGEKAVIEGNLFVGGSLVQMRGKVNGTIFGGAASMVVSETASVGRNMFFGGYDLQTKAGAKINRDLYAGGAQVRLGGFVQNVKIGAAAVEISGTIQGNAELYVSQPGVNVEFSVNTWRMGQPNMPAQIAAGLRIAEGAKIGGKLTYTSELEQSSAIQSQPAGGVVYQTPVPDERQTRQTEPVLFRTNVLWGGLWIWNFLRTLVAALVLGGLALWLFPGIFQKALAQLQQRSLASMAVGLLELLVVLFAIPTVAIGLVLLGLFFGLLTLVDLAGIILGLGFALYGLAITVFFLLFAWTGKLLIAYLIGVWLLNRLAPQTSVHPYWKFALGAVIVMLVGSIPVAGFLFNFLMDVAGVGALLYVWRNRKA